MSQRIAFIGGGNMAHALATRLAARHPGGIVVSEPVAAQRARFAAPIVVIDDNLAAAESAAVIVLAVKPQVLASVVRQIAPAVDADQLIVSIAAGVPIAAIEGWLGGGKAVVRCMPNTPALVGAGITGLVANDVVSAAQRQAAQNILECAGDVVWCRSDADLDAVTALSGSGPAYFFHIIETLTDAGQELGLPADIAKRLVVATAAGAARLAADDDPAELRVKVTSPGGTTERALAILAQRSFASALADAARGAFDRSRELAQEFAGEFAQEPRQS